MSVRIRIAAVVMLVGVLLAPQAPSRAATASDTLVYVNDISGTKEGDSSAVGSDPVVASLPKPSGRQAFLCVLTFPVGAIVEPGEAMAHQSGSDRGEAWLRNHAAGTGPYMLDRWDPESRAVLVANPNYWGPKPRLSRVIIQHVPESSTQ